MRKRLSGAVRGITKLGISYTLLERGKATLMKIFATEFAHAKGAPGAREMLKLVINVTYSTLDRSVLIAVGH